MTALKALSRDFRELLPGLGRLSGFSSVVQELLHRSSYNHFSFFESSSCWDSNSTADLFGLIYTNPPRCPLDQVATWSSGQDVRHYTYDVGDDTFGTNSKRTNPNGQRGGFAYRSHVGSTISYALCENAL